MLALEGFRWGDGLADAWSKIATFAPKLLAFLVILVVGRIVIGFVRRAIGKGLKRGGFDRVVERGGLTKALSGSGSTPSATVARLAFYALWLLLLTTAFAVFGRTNPISTLLDRIVGYLPKVFVAIAIVVVAGLIARAVTELVANLLHGKVGNVNLLARGAGVAVMVVGVFAALDQLQVAPAIVNGLFFAALAVIVGSAVIAIGGGGIVPMRRQWDRAINRMEVSDGVVDIRTPASTDQPTSR